MGKGKNGWALMLLILCGMALGGIVGDIIVAVNPSLSVLTYNRVFGLESPIVLNLGIFVINFTIQLRITIAALIGALIAGVIYKFL